MNIRPKHFNEVTQAFAQFTPTNLWTIASVHPRICAMVTYQARSHWAWSTTLAHSHFPCFLCTLEPDGKARMMAKPGEA